MKPIRGSFPWTIRRGAPRHDFLELLHRKAWHAEALCADSSRADFRWFFSERSSEQRAVKGFTEAEARAKTCCAQCPVRKDCLQEGLYEPAGIWGGTLPTQRSRYRHTADCEPGTKWHPRNHMACNPDWMQVAHLLVEMEVEAQEHGLVPRTEEVA